MSADNYIGVAKKNGGYAVWMGFASEEFQEIPGSAFIHSSATKAVKFAQDWYAREHIVEYGIDISEEVEQDLLKEAVTENTGGIIAAVLEDIVGRRLRQQKLYPGQTRSPSEWLATLTMELGEITKMTLFGKDYSTSDYWDELVQVAACSIAALESMYLRRKAGEIREESRKVRRECGCTPGPDSGYHECWDKEKESAARHNKPNA